MNPAKTIFAPASPGFPASVPAWEKGAVALILAVFAALCANEIRHDAFVGQDFSLHMASTNRLLGRPDQWFFHDTTERPMVYWVALTGSALPGLYAPYALAAAIFTALNTGALALVHASLRHMMVSPLLRVAALATIALAPVTLVTTVVFAADTLTMPFFALLAWGLVRWQHAPTLRAALEAAAVAGLALTVAQLAKATFSVLPAAVLAVALWHGRRHAGSARRVAGLIVLAVVIPGLAGVAINRASQRALANQPDWHRFVLAGTGELTWRSLVLPKPGDARILAAPTYWDREVRDGVETMPLLEANGFSYPALLHLGIFTDVLDFARGRKAVGHSTPRPEPQQTLSRWSVRTGLAFFIAGIIAAAVNWYRVARGAVRRGAAVREGLVPWLAAATVWYAPIVLVLPMIHHAYDWGYWTPRLVVPALWGFAIGLFVLLDEALAGRVWATRVVAGAALGQAALMGASVWY